MSVLLLTCPACGSPPLMVIGPTQAICANDEDCTVVIWNPSLPDGGMSDPQVIDIPE